MAQPLAELPAHGQRVQVQTEYTGITDKPSTRLHAPPGGHQSINIFGGEDYPAVPARLKPTPAQTEAPARAVAPAQPTNTGMAAGGRVQVNTEHTGISDRSSTRLHAPPGGKQSINIFGGGEEMPAKVQRVVAPAQAADTGMAAGGRIQVNTEHTGISDRSSTRLHAPPGGKQSINVFGGGEEAPAPARAAAPAQPTNTGMAAGGRVQVNTEHTGISDRSSTRLHAPPGGKQNLNIFGGDEEMPAKVQRVVAPAQAVDTGMAAGGRIQVNTEHTGISDRSSTRLHAPPGGKQSINIFGGGEEAPAPARAVAPAQVIDTGMAAGGRVQVNTEHTGISDRSSTRLHAPPGGKQSINIFAQEVVAGSAEDRMAAMKARRQERPY